MIFDIVIPNYNGSELIKKNLPKVILSIESYKDTKIIVVDDCSASQDFKQLEEFVSNINGESKIKIVLLRNNRNLGFSSTINRGVKESYADLVVLLNTDVVPSKGFIEPAIEDLKLREHLFGVGFMDESIEGQKKILRGRGLAQWNRGFLIHRRGEVDKTDTFWISGGSSVFRRELFLKMGGFDSIYNPFYWEDIDLSYRARKSGFEIKFNPRCVVEHRHEEGSIKKHYVNSKIKRIAYRNQFIFVWKNITDTRLIISHVIWLPYHLIRAFFRLDIPFFAGFLIAIFCLPDIIDKRFKQKLLYIKRDSELIKAI